MSEPKSRVKIAIGEAVAILKNATQKLLNDLVTSDSIESLDEEHDLFQVQQESTLSDFKKLMKLFTGKEYTLVQINPIAEDAAKEETESTGSGRVGNIISKSPRDESEGDSAVGRETPEHDYDDDDDDRTVFEGVGGERINDELTGTSSHHGETQSMNNDTHQHHVPDQAPCYLDSDVSTVVLPGPNAIEAPVEVHRVQSENGVNSQETGVSDLQDTLTSVSDFRVYNRNKNTLIGSNQKAMAWKERVETYLGMMSSEGAIVPNSTTESVISRFDDTDDNMSSISQAIQAQSSSVKQVGNEENIENAPTNDPKNVQMKKNSYLIEEVAGKIPDSQTSDDIEIVFDQKKNPNRESETFHVNNVADDSTMSCVSESLLKTVEERCSTVNKEAAEQKHVSVTGRKSIFGTSEDIDLTLDSGDENGEINEIVTHNNNINIPSNEGKDGENGMNVHEILDSIDTLLVDSEGTDVFDKNMINRIVNLVENIIEEINDKTKTNETTSETSNVNSTCEKVNDVTESSVSKLIQSIDIILDSDDETIEDQSRDNAQGAINESIGSDVPTRPEGANENENNTHIPNKSIKEKSQLPKETSEQPTIDDTSMEENEMNPNDTHGGEIDPVENDGCSKRTTKSKESMNAHGAISDFKLEQESVHIIDDYTLNNSQELGSCDVEYPEEKCVLSQGGNFIEDDVKDEPEDPYEVIPSVKVEVVMNGDTTDDEYLTFEDTPEADAPCSAKKKKTNKDFKTPLPPKSSLNRTKSDRIETTDTRKKCELGITSATRDIPFNDSTSISDISSLSSKLVKKRLGPKSMLKTNGPRTASKQLGTSNGERDKVSDQIKNLTNINNLDKDKPQNSSSKSKRKKRKKPSLLDFFYENENPSTNSSQSSNENSLISKIKTVNQISAEKLAREAILRSDCESEDGNVPPEKQQKRHLGETKKNDGANIAVNRTSKSIPSWKKDPLLTGNINLSSSSNGNNTATTSSSSGNQIKHKVTIKRKKINDDDVHSVCSLIQEKVKDPNLKENLKKLLDAREVIDISSDEEEEEDEDDDTEDIESVLDEDNRKQLNTKFRSTAKIRSQRIKKRTRNFVPRTPPSCQECVTFEDKYKDTPPFVLNVDGETGEQVRVCPFFSKILKDHQKRGVQFMWDVCFGNRKKILSDPGSGCILAHDMGLGKSLQIIALLHTLKQLDNIPITKILILSPKSLVQNWEDEVNKWTKGLQVRLKVFSWSTDKNIAVQDLHEWSGLGGIYILGYEMFVSVCKRSQSSGKELSVDWTTFFLNPGPDVIICDEAHMLKNRNSEKYKMVSQVKTKRRIALTGTPIQNNLQELFNIVNFVQPTFMKPDKFRDQFIEPISLAQKSDAKPYEKKKALDRISVLQKELEKVMDREEGNNQEVGLPPKLNYDVFLCLTPIQKKLYKFFFDKLGDVEHDPKRNFEVGRKAEMIGIHPKSLELVNNKTRSQKKAEQKYEWPLELQGDWWHNVLTRNERECLSEIDTGVKIATAFQILSYAARNKEKVLIFCDSHEVLNLMQIYLEQNGYKKDVNYFRLDCSVPPLKRRKHLNSFNDENNTEAKVFLLTHKVGGVGLNFTGANRIIIFDMLWNPAHHEQSSNRTHRLGQKKTSFVYRLITKDSLEESIYKNSVSKQSLSKRVVDKKNIKSQCRETGVYNFTYRETARPKKPLPEAKDDLLNHILHKSNLNIVHSYQEHGELFELSEEQLNEAQAYEEYLVESRTFDQQPGETKRKRKRKWQEGAAAENQLPDCMMSRDHLDNYDHAHLLKRINQATPPAKPVQQVPMNLSQRNSTPSLAGCIPPPPPLVRIPRDGNRQKTKAVPSAGLQNQQKKDNRPSRDTDDQRTNQATQAFNAAFEKSLYSSLPDFIHQAEAKRGATDISSLASTLANNAVEIIPRPLANIGNASSMRPNDPEQSAAPVQKRRLSINPDIFKRPSPIDRDSHADQVSSSQNQNNLPLGPHQTNGSRKEQALLLQDRSQPLGVQNENAPRKGTTLDYPASPINAMPALARANVGKRRPSPVAPTASHDDRTGETRGSGVPVRSTYGGSTSGMTSSTPSRMVGPINGPRGSLTDTPGNANGARLISENGARLDSENGARRVASTPVSSTLMNTPRIPRQGYRTMGENSSVSHRHQQQQQNQYYWLRLDNGTCIAIRSDNIDELLDKGLIPAGDLNEYLRTFVLSNL